MLGQKGGIGKSTVCTFLAQGLQRAGRKVGLIDLDPATQTLVKFNQLEIIDFKDMISEEMGEIDSARFDDLIEIVNSRSDFDDIIMDSGSSNIISLINYLKRNDSFSLFENQGHDVIIHTVIAGGDMTSATLKTLGILHEDFRGTDKILWLNEYAHRMEIDGAKGVEAVFKTPIYNDAKESIKAVFALPSLHPQLEANLINGMLDKGILFSEVDKSDEFKLAEKNRLNKFATIVLGQISEGMRDILTETEAEALA